MPNIPLWSPRFVIDELEPFKLKYKPFPSYLNNLVAWDLEPLVTEIGGNINDALGAAQAAQVAADAAQAAADAAQAAADAIISIPSSQFDRFSVFGDDFTWTNDSGTRGVTFSTNYPYSWINYSTVNAAEANCNVLMNPGTWTIYVLTTKRNDHCKLTFTIDTTPIFTQHDLYAASPDNAYKITTTNITIGAGLSRALSLLAHLKNAASSGYVMTVNKVWGYRTG